MILGQKLKCWMASLWKTSSTRTNKSNKSKICVLRRSNLQFIVTASRVKQLKRKNRFKDIKGNSSIGASWTRRKCIKRIFSPRRRNSPRKNASWTNSCSETWRKALVKAISAIWQSTNKTWAEPVASQNCSSRSTLWTKRWAQSILFWAQNSSLWCCQTPKALLGLNKTLEGVVALHRCSRVQDHLTVTITMIDYQYKNAS